MTKRKRRLCGTISAIAVLVLIFDSKTAFRGAVEGVQLCVETLIPSLFPFILFTSILNSVFFGAKIPIVNQITKHLGIPDGAEFIYIIGMLGGYPIGAKAVFDTYKSGQIDKPTAFRLIGFCNNAGPAFIFGVIGTMFGSLTRVWLIWIIHILSSLMVGLLLPGKTTASIRHHTTPSEPLSYTFQSSLKAMATVCGWVIIFRMIIHFMNHWFASVFLNENCAWIFGVLELTNGCIALNDISSDGWKFIICSGLLSFGGLCVWMQTVSVTKELGNGMYLFGKILQTCFSLMMACAVQMVFIENTALYLPVLIFASIASLCLVFVIRHKKKL